MYIYILQFYAETLLHTLYEYVVHLADMRVSKPNEF